MSPLTIPTICMSLVAGALAGKAGVFVRDSSLVDEGLMVTVSAHSQTACSILCEAHKQWRCGEFRYLANGTCELYQDVCNTDETPPPDGTTTTTPPAESTTASDQAAIYRRPSLARAPPSACPGQWLIQAAAVLASHWP